jgi:hypothetical protein
MVRVTQLVETGHWFDDTIARSNAPYGERLHWTRPLDVLLIAGAAPLAAFTGWERALWLWGVSLSPTLLAAAAVVFALGLGLRREEHALLAVLLVMCQPALMHQCAAARPDHHSLLVFCAVLAAVLARRAMMRRFAHATAVYAGLACALGIWVSVEFLPLAAWICGGTAIVGILHGTWAMDRTRRMAWGLAVGLLAAVLSSILPTVGTTAFPTKSASITPASPWPPPPQWKRHGTSNGACAGGCPDARPCMPPPPDPPSPSTPGLGLPWSQTPSAICPKNSGGIGWTTSAISSPSPLSLPLPGWLWGFGSLRCLS